jgi:hypothetical protein
VSTTPIKPGEVYEGNHTGTIVRVAKVYGRGRNRTVRFGNGRSKNPPFWRYMHITKFRQRFTKRAGR